MERLIELEYVLVHGGGQGRRISYELLYDGRGKDGRSFVCGLLDVEAIRHGMGMTKTSEGKTPNFGGRSDPDLTPCGPRLEGSVNPRQEKEADHSSEEPLKNAHLGRSEKSVSYRRDKGNGSAAIVEEAD